MTDDAKGSGRHPRTLITGGAGFLGSHLCDHLIAEGHRVICLDNLLTGRMENIQHLLAHPRFVFQKCDVTVPFTLPVNDHLDFVLDFASPASPKDYERYPIETLHAGSLGTWRALEIAKAHGSTFLLASTSEVYGDPEVNPQPETYWGHVNPNGPRSVYDEAKRFAEAIAMAYHRAYGVPVRIVRIFNTYGERMRLNDGRALPNFLRQALRNKPLTIYGDGSQTRSLCYVSDLVEGIYRLLLSDETGPVNIGNPDEITIRELAEEIIELTGSLSELVSEPLPPDDPCLRRPDISKAIATLGWQPRVSRHEGIQRVIEYFKAELENCQRDSENYQDETVIR